MTDVTTNQRELAVEGIPCNCLVTSTGVGTSGPDPNGIGESLDVLLVVTVVVVTVIGSGTCAESAGAQLGVMVGAAANKLVACADAAGSVRAALADAMISAECKPDVANEWNPQYYVPLLLPGDTHHSV